MGHKATIVIESVRSEIADAIEIVPIPYKAGFYAAPVGEGIVDVEITMDYPFDKGDAQMQLKREKVTLLTTIAMTYMRHPAEVVPVLKHLIKTKAEGWATVNPFDLDDREKAMPHIKKYLRDFIEKAAAIMGITHKRCAEIGYCMHQEPERFRKEYPNG